MNLQVCISSLGEGIAGLIDRLPCLDRVSYLVGWQQALDQGAIYEAWKTYCLQRSDIEVVTLESLGLSRNRNELLRHASGDILLIADDDIDYLPDFSTKIFQAYQRYPEADILTFQFQSNKVKNYPKKSYLLDFRSTARVSSIEISARRESLLADDLLFDEVFGLGTQSPSGEEFIFLTDALKAKLNVRFVPVFIVSHSDISSGHDFYSDKNLIRTKGRMLSRVFGPITATLLSLMFAIKKYSKYRHQMGFWAFLSEIIWFKDYHD